MKVLPLVVLTCTCSGCVTVDRVPEMDLWLYDRDGKPHTGVRVDVQASRTPGTEAWSTILHGVTDAAGKIHVDQQTELAWVGLRIFLHAPYAYGFNDRLVIWREKLQPVTLDLAIAAAVQVLLDRTETRARVLSFYHSDSPLPRAFASKVATVPFLALPNGETYGRDVQRAVVRAAHPAGCKGAEYSPGLRLVFSEPEYAEVNSHLFDEEDRAVPGYDGEGCMSEAP
jgi:hypothetical protein